MLDCNRDGERVLKWAPKKTARGGEIRPWVNEIKNMSATG